MAELTDSGWARRSDMPRQ